MLKHRFNLVEREPMLRRGDALSERASLFQTCQTSYKAP